ncbi:hypothetical protein ED857_19490, partial [Acinetobacter baumannii]
PQKRGEKNPPGGFLKNPPGGFFKKRGAPLFWGGFLKNPPKNFFPPGGKNFFPPGGKKFFGGPPFFPPKRGEKTPRGNKL